MASIRTIRTYCHSCGHDTRHEILFSKEIRADDPEYFWEQSYCVAKCCGCEELSFVRITEEEGVVDDDGNVIPQYETFPYKIGEADAIEAHYVPYPIRKVYEEALIAYNNGCELLAAAGFRATIEAICKDKAITGTNLQIRINNLQKGGHITLQDRDRLHTIRFLGNDSIHEMKVPSKRDLYLLLEIVNSTLTNLYVLDEKTRVLEKPVSTFEDFIDIVEVRLLQFKKGSIVTLKDILNKDRRIMDEERKKFEAEMIANIQNGNYSRLNLDPNTASGKAQQYIVNR